MRGTTVLLLSAGLCASAHGQLVELVLGRADDWSDLATLQGTQLVAGRWGDLDLVLDDALDASAANGTDLWLSFDPAGRPFGGYRVGDRWSGSGAPTVTDAEFVRGGSSGVFHGSGGVSLVPDSHSLFAPGALNADFSMQFWLYPAAMQDGEELLGWSGSATILGSANAKRGDGEQQLLVTIQDRRVEWRLEGLFRAADGSAPGTQTLTGLSPLVPRQWHHHLLRFDSRYGTLEYLVDGTPHAITHVTTTGRESGTPGSHWVGSGRQSPLRIGETFVGLMDDVQFSHTVAEPELSRYRGRVGWAATRVFDLGHADSSLVAVDVVSDNSQSNAEIFYYYRIADLPFSPLLPAGGATNGPVAVQFDPSQPFVDASRGRYLQLVFELLPSGATASAAGRRTDRSPRLHELRIRYLPVAPPPSPRRVMMAAGDSAVRITWRPANGALGGEIGGYFVFYGTQSGQYLPPTSGATPGKVADQGPSPIDVGGANELLLTGLTNGTVYYVAVASYDGFEPPMLSRFSAEAAARPSAIRQLQVRTQGTEDASLAGMVWQTQR